jgi:hypothetical protein
VLNCCAAASEKSNHLGWLVPELPERDLWDVRLRLLRCPACRALWTLKSTCQGHQDWDEALWRVDSQQAFEDLVRQEEGQMKSRIEALKRTYAENGWEWKW